jgi:hypothetical protein
VLEVHADTLPALGQRVNGTRAGDRVRSAAAGAAGAPVAGLPAMFETFDDLEIDAGDTTIFVRRAGSGPRCCSCTDSRKRT